MRAAPPDSEANPDDAAVARIAARLSAEYFLRAVQLLLETHGDPLDGIIAQTINTANTAHLDAGNGGGQRNMATDQTPPDDVRRPISIARIAESLGLPFETTRRRVQRLIDAGACARIEGGLIVTQAFLERPEVVRSDVANVGYLCRLVGDLQAAGLGAVPRAPPGET